MTNLKARGRNTVNEEKKKSSFPRKGKVASSEAQMTEGVKAQAIAYDPHNLEIVR